MPAVRQPPHIAALAVALALLLIWPVSIAVRNGLSGIYARPAIDYLEEKRFATDSFSESQWRAIENSVTHAAALMPGNPQYLEALGRLHQIRLSVFSESMGIKDMDAHANAATAYFSMAIESRPTWPYYWGNLALEHYRRGNVASAVYGQAMANAARFGPWKNDTQRLIMDLGSETWPFLDADVQREFILNLERGLHRQPQNTVRIVRDNDAWVHVCAANDDLFDISLPHLATLCAHDQFVRKADQY